MPIYTPPSSPSINLNLTGDYTPPLSGLLALNLTNNVRTLRVDSCGVEVSTNLSNLTYIRYIIFPVSTMPSYSIIVYGETRYYKKIPIDTSNVSSIFNNIDWSRTYVNYITPTNYIATPYEFVYLYGDTIYVDSVDSTVTLNDVNYYKQLILPLENSNIPITIEPLGLLPYRSSFEDSEEIPVITNPITLDYHRIFSINSATLSLGYKNVILRKPILFPHSVSNSTYSLSLNSLPLSRPLVAIVDSSNYSYSTNNLSYSISNKIKIKKDLSFNSNTGSVFFKYDRKLFLNVKDFSINASSINYNKYFRTILDSNSTFLSNNISLYYNKKFSIVNNNSTLSLRSISYLVNIPIEISSLSIECNLGAIGLLVYRGTEDLNPYFVTSPKIPNVLIDSTNKNIPISSSTNAVINSFNKIIVKESDEVITSLPKNNYIITSSPKQIL